MKEYILLLEGLNCASCALKIEEQTKGIKGVDNVDLDFITKKMKINIPEESNPKGVIKEIKHIINTLEPDVKILEDSIRNSNNESEHYHEDLNKFDIAKIVMSLVLLIIPSVFGLKEHLRIGIYIISYLVVGFRIIIRAIKNLFRMRPFDENFLMAIATVGAFAIGEYPEGVAVMLFYQMGEFFQNLAANHSRKSIKALLDIRPDYANIENNGEIISVDPMDVHIGDYIIIKPGEKVPLDGIIVEGKSSFDSSNITGESLPRTAGIGDSALSGFINKNGLLRVKVEKEFKDSTVSKLLDLVENSAGKKAPTENFITRFARYYTPAVVIAAIIIGLFPPLILGRSLSEWAYKAFVFLVVSCPCALVISIPLGFFGGLGGASKAGILIKGGNYLEGLNGVDTIVFDKTGTITKGTFKVTEIDSHGDITEGEVLELAAIGEYYSNHPIGRSIADAYGKEVDKARITDYKDIAGKGIQAKIDGDDILIGNSRLFMDNGIQIIEKESIGTVVFISKNGIQIGTIVVSDELKENVITDIKNIKSNRIKRIMMLSGDNEEIVNKIGKSVGMDKVYGNLLPQDKVMILEEIIKESKGKVAFVGDGVNDAPVLARADIGIAMGALGSDAAIEASDIVIMTDEIGKIATGIRIASNTKRIVVQNIIFALGVKLLVLALGALGMATMWEAVFADVGVSIIAILNSIRALKYN